MFRILRRWAQPMLYVAAIAAGIDRLQAHRMIYDQDGYSLAVGIEAGLGDFAVDKVDTGAGNINTDAPLQAPFPPSERRTTRGCSRALPNRSSNWKRRFSISATPTRSSASSAH